MTPSPYFPPPAEDSFEFIVESPLDLVQLLKDAHDPKAGAVVLFSGDVRDHNIGKDVLCLEYEAHLTLASQMIKNILREAIQKWSLSKAIAQHRIGRVEIGESAVVVITSSPHRKEAYIANRFIIDKIKHEVPIWKCELYANGTMEWGNNCNCAAVTGNAEQHIYDRSL